MNDPDLQTSSQPVLKKTMRPAAIAGQFYPADPAELRNLVDDLINEAQKRPGFSHNNDLVAKAIIVPHAGYRYSGEVAASAYAQIGGANRSVSRVVLLGPAHRVSFSGLGFSTADYFSTPLGKIPLDTSTARQCVTRYPFASFNNKAHQHEHSLETQLPFLQCCLGDFVLLPIVIGAAEPEQVARALAHVWGSNETLVIISSDLSHFLPYREAREKDAFTSQSICNLDPQTITYQHACGQLGVRGLLQVARQKKMTVRQLDVRNSGDTAGRRDQVVGYGSYGFYRDQNKFSYEQRNTLTAAALATIDHGLETGKMMSPPYNHNDPIIMDIGASFVSLKDTAGKLRGCIGTLTSTSPLLVNVCHNAYKSAFNDGRFKPLTAKERSGISLEISVLSQPERIKGAGQNEIIDQVRPFVDGLIFTDLGKRSTFLPAVWQSIPDPDEFFRQLKRKGGFDPDHWSESVEVFRYTTESWKDTGK